MDALRRHVINNIFNSPLCCLPLQYLQDQALCSVCMGTNKASNNQDAYILNTYLLNNCKISSNLILFDLWLKTNFVYNMLYYLIISALKLIATR